MNPIFSIIIPLYNKEHYILDTLKSVKKQSFKNYEVIIINDGSTDNSKFISQNYIKKFDNVTLVNQENKGLSFSRNLGVKKAKGSLIAFLDSDDKWHFDFLKTCYNLFTNFTEATIYGTDYFEVKKNKLLIPQKKIDKNLKNTSFLIDDFFKVNMYQSIICQSSICLKKEVFNDVLFNEAIDFSEDIDFYLNLFTNGHKLAYQYEPLSYILIDVPNQITKSSIKNKTIPDFDSFEKLASKNNNLKRYLDFNRYTFASKYRFSKNKEQFELVTKHLNLDNLNYKQRFILTCPIVVFNSILTLKSLLFKFNIKWSTF